MHTEKSYNNPLHLLKLSVSEFVWKWYDKQVKEEFSLLAIDGEHSYHNLSTSWRNYINGNRKARFSSFNLHMKDILERVLPIKDSTAFFMGTEIEKQNEALETAARMIQAFDKEHQRQLKSVA